MKRSIINKNINFGATPEMYEAIKQAAECMHITPPQICRLAVSMFLERGIDYGPAMAKEAKQREPSPAP